MASKAALPKWERWVGPVSEYSLHRAMIGEEKPPKVAEAAKAVMARQRSAVSRQLR